jgi:hypothetical protein
VVDTALQSFPTSNVDNGPIVLQGSNPVAETSTSTNTRGEGKRLLISSGTFNSNILFIVQVAHLRMSLCSLWSRSATFPAAAL